MTKAVRPARGWIENVSVVSVSPVDSVPPPQGAGGLKSFQAAGQRGRTESRPARGGWIEFPSPIMSWETRKSRPARGGWIEISRSISTREAVSSRPARGGWIEMLRASSITARGGWIEILMARKPAITRTSRPQGAGGLKSFQAAGQRGRTESRPQGAGGLKFPSPIMSWETRKSRPARGGWIEILPGHISRRTVCVPPRKGRVD